MGLDYGKEEARCLPLTGQRGASRDLVLGSPRPCWRPILAFKDEELGSAATRTDLSLAAAVAEGQRLLGDIGVKPLADGWEARVRHEAVIGAPEVLHIL